jgi:hypothetical protein
MPKHVIVNRLKIKEEREKADRSTATSEENAGATDTNEGNKKGKKKKE